MSLSNERPAEPPFEDPALRAVCRRAWCDERAPAGLRERVAGALHDEAQPGAQPSPAAAARWRIGSFRGLAAAAVVVLAVGAATGYFTGLLRTQGTPQTARSRIPDTLAVELARVHHSCARAPDHHHLSSPSQNQQEIASLLRARLGRPVLSCGTHDLDPDGGWKFCGASVCPVGGQPAGHLVFVRGQARVSVFSLPAGACPGVGPGQACETAGGACNIAAFRQGDGFFCVVGSSDDGSFGCDQVRALRDKLRPNAVASGADIAGPPLCRF